MAKFVTLLGICDTLGLSFSRKKVGDEDNKKEEAAVSEEEKEGERHTTTQHSVHHRQTHHQSSQNRDLTVSSVSGTRSDSNSD